MGKPKIIQNEVQCDNCGDIIHSASVHSCVQCSCGGVTVDGGMEYLRRLGHAQSYTERSMTLNETTINELSEKIIKLGGKPNQENKNQQLLIKDLNKQLELLPVKSILSDNPGFM